MLTRVSPAVPVCVVFLTFAVSAGRTGGAPIRRLRAQRPARRSPPDVHASGDAHATYDAGLRLAAGALRGARLRRAPHRRRRQAVRDALRTATADRLERPVPVSGRRRQRRHRRAGCRAQHGIVSRHGPAARLRGGDHGRGPSGRDARVWPRSHRRASIMRTRRTNGPRRSPLRSCRAITAARPIANTSSAARAAGVRA